MTFRFGRSIIDDLVECVRRVLPVTEAAVTRISPATAPQYVARLERGRAAFQAVADRVRQGPRLAARVRV